MEGHISSRTVQNWLFSSFVESRVRWYLKATGVSRGECAKLPLPLWFSASELNACIMFSLQEKMQCRKTSTEEEYAQEAEREREEKDSLQKERDLLRKVTSTSARLDNMRGLMMIWAKLSLLLFPVLL